jgi:hypothetical protein
VCNVIACKILEIDQTRVMGRRFHRAGGGALTCSASELGFNGVITIERRTAYAAQVRSAHKTICRHTYAEDIPGFGRAMHYVYAAVLRMRIVLCCDTELAVLLCWHLCSTSVV